MRFERWQQVQEMELQYHLKKDQTRLLQLKVDYWNSLLDRVRPHVPFLESTRALDIGCGSCSILLALDRGTLVGVDPLMDQYLEHFPFLQDTRPEWVSGTAEESSFPQPFDVVFTVNALDHMFDPARAAARIDELLVPGGHVVVSVNCHNTAFFHRYYRKFYALIDRFHPHQFRPKDIESLFPGYESILVEDIDDLYLVQRTEYRRDVLRKPRVPWGTMFKYMFNPMRYPVLGARLAGYQIHRTKPHQRSLYSNYLFVLKKPVAPSA